MDKYVSIYCLWAIFLISCLSAQEIKEENGYIFTCPRSLKAGANNQLQLRRFGKLNAGVLKVQVTYHDSYSSNISLATEQSYDIEEGVVDSFLTLPLEPFENYVYNGKITINGTFDEYIIGGGDKVYFTDSKDSIVFIQTDKPLYKEGQTVKFRVLRVDKDLKPLVEDVADIWVEDPTGTRLFQWKDVSLGKGMKQFQFRLADEPVNGDWKIAASFKGDVTSTSFEVKEYVLPTFDVKIKQPPFVLADDDVIPITVCAHYTYGKPVKGNLRMNISLETYTWSNDKLPTIEYEGKIDGCFEYIINVSMIETEDYYRYRRPQIVASVEELATGVQRNKTEYVSRQYSPFSLNFNRDQKQFYKPGLPYNGKIFVKNPDNTPTINEDIQVCYTVTKERVVMDGKWKATRTVKYCQNYTSDNEGVVDFVIPRQNVDSVGINIEAKSLRYASQNKRGTPRQTSLSQPQSSMSLTPWYSPSGSFVQLQQVQETLLCGTKRSIKVLFTSKTDGDFTFHYQVLSQGKVVRKGSVEKSFSVTDDVSKNYEDKDKVIDDAEVQVVPALDRTPSFEIPDDSSSSSSESKEDECKSAKEARYVPPIGEVDIDIDIDASWSPSFHLLVYYIRDDRETVADSQKFTVEKCFKNQVKFQFGDDVKQPGTKTSIRVTSSPNSLCGVKVVDKSVALMNPDDQLTSEKIFRILENLDNGMYYGVNHCNEDVRQPGLYMASSQIHPPRPPQPWSSSSYEDSLAGFENAGLLVISDLILFTRPCKSRGGGGNIVYEDSNYGGYGGAGSYYYNSDSVAMASTARRPAAPPHQGPPGSQISHDIGSEETATKSVVEVRDYFPETWLFDMEMTDEEGTFVTKEKLPHTITEWVGSAICINEENGLGLSNSTSIKGFQAFFIATTLPYSVVRGEMFWITVSIFSYVEKPLPIKVSLDKMEGFEVISESIDGDICVQPGSSTNLKVQLKGVALGALNITVRAETAQSSEVCASESISEALAKDAITKSVIVEAEGWPVEDTESVLFCPKDEENEVFERTLAIDAPEDVITDSFRSYLDVSGNVLGKSLDNLENLVTLPTGCGEQNMVKFAPNVVVMSVLTETNALTDKLKARIVRNLNAGAQRQLQYKHSDGSFSAFGSRDKQGSMFLTAFVLRYFSEADKYVDIDNKTLVRMQNWITSKQQLDGCFPDVGKILDRGLQGSIESDKSQGTITAYVLASLLISGYQNQTVLDNALSCISGSEDTSLYATFLYAYAETLAGKKDSAKERIQSAKGKAIKKGKAEYYHDINATRSQDLETNAYAILSILNSGGSAFDVLPIVQYLTKNMNPQGGFFSTQDTCMGMEALGAFAKLTFKDPVDITIKVTGGLEKEIEIKEDEKLVVQRHKVDEVPSEVHLEAKGSGCAVIQKILRYNSKTSPEKRNFNLEAVGKCSDDQCKRGTISLSFSYIPEDRKTGMSLIEVKMSSGLAPVKESLEKLLEDNTLKLMRYDVENNVVVFYFNEITNNEKGFSFEVERVIQVENSQPGTIKLYDYYNRDVSSSTTYSVANCEDSTSCTKEP
nr:venom protein [Lampona murina]